MLILCAELTCIDCYGCCSHGTRCAGEIAAKRDNEICGVGVAYGSRVAGNTVIFVAFFIVVVVLLIVFNSPLLLFFVFTYWSYSFPFSSFFSSPLSSPLSDQSCCPLLQSSSSLVLCSSSEYTVLHQYTVLTACTTSNHYTPNATKCIDYNTIICSAINTMQYDAIQYYQMQYNTIKCNTVQCEVTMTSCS